MLMIAIVILISMLIAEFGYIIGCVKTRKNYQKVLLDGLEENRKLREDYCGQLIEYNKRIDEIIKNHSNG